MHSRFLLVPVAIVAFSQTASGLDLQTLELAQQRLYPGKRLVPE